jgi:uncharacterized protein
MYIEQLKKIKVNDVAYIIGIVSILGFFGINILSAIFLDTNVNDTLQVLITQFGKTVTFIILVFPLSFLCVLLLLWVKFINGQSITSLTTSRDKIDWKRVAFMFGIWSLFLVLTTVVSYLFFPLEIIFQFNWIKFLPFAIVATLLIPLQIGFEEYFFRGYMMQYIGYRFNSRIIPLFVTSVLFGVMHLSNPEIDEMGYWLLIFYIGTGFILGIFTLMDDGLELALGFHAANNLIGALLITSDNSVFQTDSVFKDISTNPTLYPIILQVFVVYPVLLYICAKKYKWTNWKQNLLGKLAE